MIIDVLSFLAQSWIFLWSIVASILIIFALAYLLRKPRAILSYNQKIEIGWLKRLTRLFMPALIVLLLGGGLIMLIRTNVATSEDILERKRTIDAVYLLDISGSMASYYSLASGDDCIDRKGFVRIEGGRVRADCAVITVLDRLLVRNSQVNVLVILFGGTVISVGPTTDHDGLMDAVWFNWAKVQYQSYSLTSATDIKQALLKAWAILKYVGGEPGQTPIIIASDFGDWDQNALIQLIYKLADEGANMVAIGINYNTSVLERIRDRLGAARVLTIDNPEDIENISLDLGGQSPAPDIYTDRDLHLEKGFSESVLLGTGMLATALVLGILFVRTIRLPGSE